MSSQYSNSKLGQISNTKQSINVTNKRVTQSTSLSTHQGTYLPTKNIPAGSPPIKLLAFPKLIDQMKEGEIHKSCIKLTTASQMNESPEMNNQVQPFHVSFKNQYLNDSIQAANAVAPSTTYADPKKRKGQYATQTSKDQSFAKESHYGGLRTEKGLAQQNGQA